MKKWLFIIFALLIIYVGCAGSAKISTDQVIESSAIISLDEAIAAAAVRIDERIEAGTKIALINFNSHSERFSFYVLDELSANLLDSGKLVVVDRREIDLIRTEFDFQFSGEVGDDSMQALGRMLGAQSIVSGSLTEIGGSFRIVFRALDVQSAVVVAQYRTDIAIDNRVLALIDGGRSSTVTTAPGRTSPAPSIADNEIIFNGRRYVRFDISLTWTAAKAYVERLGGHLATITSQEEQNIIYSLVRNGTKMQYWLGADRPGNWITGERWTFENWASGQPDNYLNIESYVQMWRLPNPLHPNDSDRGKWNDAPVDNTLPGEENFFSLQHVGFIGEFPL